MQQGDGNAVADPRLLREYGEAKASYEHALNEYDKVIGPVLSEEQQQEYETLRDEYTTILQDVNSESVAQIRRHSWPV